MALEYPMFNGNRYTWASMVINVGAQVFIGCKSFNLDEKFDATKIWGTTQAPIGVGAPRYDADASMEVYQQEGDALLVTLMQTPVVGRRTGYANVPFDVQFQYIEDNQPTVTVKARVRLAGRGIGGSEGADVLTTRFPLFVMAPVVTLIDGVSVQAVNSPNSSIAV